MMSVAERTEVTAISCKVVVSRTGMSTGSGIGAYCWIYPGMAIRRRGAQRRMTRTHLLGDLRFDGRIGWGEGSLWIKNASVVLGTTSTADFF